MSYTTPTVEYALGQGQDGVRTGVRTGGEIYVYAGG
jgi:hypothetical protein